MNETAREGWPVRFAEGHQAETTPVAIRRGAAWEPVRLLCEERVAQANPRAPVLKRFWVADRRGRRWLVSETPLGGWSVSRAQSWAD